MTKKSKLAILVVDDSPVNLKLLQNVLIREGYAVFTAENGPLSRQLALEYQPDLILLDIMMPDENGFEVIRQLKKNSRTSSIPVIFLTGKDKLDDKITGFDLGAVDYITKPFHVKEVLARVRLHLRLSLATNSMIAVQTEKLKQLQHAQRSMMIKPEDLPAAGFGVCYLSLLEAGGDIYDVLKISDEIFGYFVGDVSGHDIATSYITAAVKALLKQNCTLVYEPMESMKMINDVLMEVLSDGKYLTASYVRLNRRTKQMSVINSGHLPVVYIPVNKEARLIESEGDILGIFNNACFGRRDIVVEKGDRFFMYTDGLIEKPGQKKVWAQGLQELLKACEQIKKIPVRESAEKLKHLMLGQSYLPEDDILVLGVEI